MTDTSEADADRPFGDTTIRRPRVPTPPDARPLEAMDESHDTVIARRGAGRSGGELFHSNESPQGDPDDPAAGAIAYASRAAAPVRGSRKAPAPRAAATPAVPDASRIRRAIRAQARRRLAAVISAIVVLVVVLVAALVALVFAVGV